jgi:hypothetical protein
VRRFQCHPRARVLALPSRLALMPMSAALRLGCVAAGLGPFHGWGATSGQLCSSALATLTADGCSPLVSAYSQETVFGIAYILSQAKTNLAFDRRALKSVVQG